MQMIMTSVVAAILGVSLHYTPRVVVSLTKGPGGTVTVRIENASKQAMALSATTYLALLKSDDPDRHGPLYWSKVENHGVPTSKPLRLVGLESSTVQVDPRSLSWSRDRTGLTPEQPIGQVVPAGNYELQVQIVDEQERWWRSGELSVTVSATGNLRF